MVHALCPRHQRKAQVRQDLEHYLYASDYATTDIFIQLTRRYGILAVSSPRISHYAASRLDTLLAVTSWASFLHPF